MSLELDDDFENPYHEEDLHKAMEKEAVLMGAGPEALAAMPGVEKVSRVWKSRSDGKRRSVEINVWYKEGAGTGCLTFTGGKWLPERFGLGPSQLSPERFGDDVYTDEDGHCWGRIEETIQPDPAKLSKFNANRNAGEGKVSKLAIAIFVAIVVAALLALTTGCGRADRAESAVSPDVSRTADFSGAIPMSWPLCKPFVDGDGEVAKDFLVVEQVKDHSGIRNSGVEPGDICLSWGTPNPEVPETLRDAWLAYLCKECGDEADCWFARDRDGRVEVFSCGMGELYECMVSLGTFGLALRPTAFPDEAVERITEAASARKKANDEERFGRHTQTVRSGVDALEDALK